MNLYSQLLVEAWTNFFRYKSSVKRTNFRWEWNSINISKWKSFLPNTKKLRSENRKLIFFRKTKQKSIFVSISHSQSILCSPSSNAYIFLSDITDNLIRKLISPLSLPRSLSNPNPFFHSLSLSLFPLSLSNPSLFLTHSFTLFVSLYSLLSLSLFVHTLSFFFYSLACDPSYLFFSLQILLLLFLPHSFPFPTSNVTTFLSFSLFLYLPNHPSSSSSLFSLSLNLDLKSRPFSQSLNLSLSSFLFLAPFSLFLQLFSIFLNPSFLFPSLSSSSISSLLDAFDFQTKRETV